MPEKQPEAPVKSVEPDYERPRKGAFVEVVDGPHRGMYGTYEKDNTYKSGEVDTVLVRNRDHATAHPHLAVVDYEHVRPTHRTGGR